MDHFFIRNQDKFTLFLIFKILVMHLGFEKLSENLSSHFI